MPLIPLFFLFTLYIEGLVDQGIIGMERVNTIPTKNKGNGKGKYKISLKRHKYNVAILSTYRDGKRNCLMGV